MATAQHHSAQHWSGQHVPIIHGLADTRIKTGEDYDTRPLGSFWKLAPTAKPKHQAFAILPSLHHGYDAREHAAQRGQGQFVALVGDIDKGDHPLSQVQGLVEAFTVGSAWTIYSTASAQASERRWRVVVPLDRPVSFAVWYDAQLAFADFMTAAEVALDTCAARPGQVSFLPNVPGDLRDSDGKPLFFEQSATSVDLPGLRLDRNPIADGMAALERKRAHDDAERERIRREAEQRRRARPISSDDASVIDTFNRSNSIENLLQLYEYEQSPRDRRDWRSPHQTSNTYATRVLDGGKWVSLSGSDAAAGFGAQCSSGCYGDAFDLFLHYDHGGNRKAAWKAACEEQGRNRPNQNDGRSYNDNDQPRRDAANNQEEATSHSAAAGEQGETTGLPFATLDLSALAAVTPKPKLFAIERLAPVGEVTLFTGPGSAGKSLLGQQLATCGAAGIQCLGLDVMSGPTLYMTCEDDEDQLHFRQAALCAALKVPMACLADTLHLTSLRGQLGSELCTFDSNGALNPTKAFYRLVAMLKATSAKLAILDNVAHLFTGNENDRGEVTRFVNLLNKLAGETGAAIVLLGHPNKGGDTYSGSTAWLNAVRSQIYMEHDLNTDLRTLTVGKANYSRKGEALRFMWQDWAFVAESDLTPDRRAELAELSRASYEDDAFMACLRARASQGVDRAVGPSPGPNYAPSQFEDMPEAKGLKKAALKRAMDRLYTHVRIRTETVTRQGKSDTKSIIVEVS